MYLRTTKRKNKDGSVATYYQLAHNTRDPKTKRPTPTIIHNFGRAEDLDGEELRRLCRSIARVCGLTVVELDRGDAGSQSNEQRPALDWPDGIRLLGTKELGTMLAIEHVWEEFGIGKILRDVCKGQRRVVKYERALLAMTANRLCEPESKLGVWDRWLKGVYLPSADGLKLEHMYEAMDILYEHSAKVEESIFFQVADLMNVEVDLIFYDTTTVSFSIDYSDEDDEYENQVGLRVLGHSKEGTWTPQVVVALAVTREGIPVRSWVLPGNTADVTTVKTVKNDLKGWKLGRSLFVADAGMNSEDNREALGRACGKYVLACRLGSVKEIKEDVLSHRGRFTKVSENLQAKEVVVGDGVRGRRYILCYNPEQAKRERHHRSNVIDELKGQLRKHKDRSAKAQWAIELLASRRFKKYVKVTEEQRLEIDREAIRKAERQDGKWVLLTNDDTITVEDAANSYKNLLVIERCFRTLKTTQIRMRPMYHWLPHRITAHVKICVLALLVERIIVLRCKPPWFRVRRVLRDLQATEFEAKEHRFFRRNEVGSEVRSVLKSLEIPMPKPVLGLSETTASL